MGERGNVFLCVCVCDKSLSLSLRLREYNDGYWPAVSYFTRSDAVKTINDLSKVTTGAGRGMEIVLVHQPVIRVCVCRTCLAEHGFE